MEHEQYEILSEIDKKHGRRIKRVKKTSYKYVHIVEYNGVLTYAAEMPKYHLFKCFPNVRDAAKAVDLELIKNNLPPVNILVKK